MSGPNPTPPQDPSQYPQYGAPQPGQPQPGQSQPGQPQPGQPYPDQAQQGQYQQSQPQPDPSQYGQPQQGQPQFGQSQYGQSQYGQPQQGQPQYGQPQPGQHQPGQPPVGQTPTPQYGAPAASGQPGGFAPFGQQLSGLSAPGGTVSPKLVPFLWGTVGAAVVVFIAAFLPWVSFTGGSVSGTGDGKDGWFTLILALVAGGLAGATVFLAAQQPILPRVASIGTLVAGVLITLIAIIDIADVMSSKNDLGPYGDIFNIKFSVGFGLWLTLLGGIALVVLGVLNIIAQRKGS